MEERQRPQPLRRRGERMREAVLDATVRLLASEGLDGTTVSAVAQAAGVHETSIYRRWATRENLIHDAAARFSDEALPMPDTGEVAGDLRDIVRGLLRFLRTREGEALLRLSRPPHLPVSSGERRLYWTARMERAEAVVRRGVERGELRTDCDPHLVVELLVGVLFTRLLLTGEPLGDDLAERLVDHVLGGVRAGRTAD